MKKALVADRSLVEDCGVLTGGIPVVAVEEVDEAAREREERSISSATDRMSSGEVQERDIELEAR